MTSGFTCDSAFWCAGRWRRGAELRVLSVWSDGGNFNNVQSANGIGMNLTYSNNLSGARAMMPWPSTRSIYNVNGSTTTYYTIMSNITYVNNTAIAPWGAGYWNLRRD